MSNSYEILQGNITRNRRLSARKIYVICSEVRVRKNVRLIIEDGTTLLIQNGKLPKAYLLRATLIFDQGSILRAKRFTVKACDSDFRPVRTADTVSYTHLTLPTN